MTILRRISQALMAAVDGAVFECAGNSWEARFDPESDMFFYINHTDKLTQWEDPREQPGPELPEGWEARLDPESGQYYYIDNINKRTQWDPPVSQKPAKKPQQLSEPLQQQNHNAPAWKQPARKPKSTASRPAVHSKLGEMNPAFAQIHGIRDPAADPIEADANPYSDFDFEPADVGMDSTDDRIIKIGTAMYIGQSDWNKQPDGHGYLSLQNNSQHCGHFAAGRVHGPGMFQEANGTVIEGEWQAQRRVGTFQVTDKQGQLWEERYNAEGEKKARKKMKDEKSQLLMVSPAKECWHCGGLFHSNYNNKYACRRHKGKWIPSRAHIHDPNGPGVWNCCGKENRAEPGCMFSSHALDHQ